MSPSKPYLNRSQSSGVGRVDYLEICADQTGQSVDIDIWNKIQEQRQHLEECSKTIADKLDQVGCDVRTDRDLCLVGLVSRGIQKITPYRAWNIIPTHARRKKKEQYKWLEWWLSKNPWARMQVFTMGPRSGFNNLQTNIREHHNLFSTMNELPWVKAVGQYVFRQTEVGTIERDEHGCPTFHPHIHGIFLPSRRLSKGEWSGFMARLQAHWGHHMKDCGVLKSASECTKYVAKPQDVMTLDGGEILMLHDISSKIRWTEALGVLRKKKKDIKEKNLRPDRVDGQWRLNQKWNKGRPKREKDERTLEERVKAPLPIHDRSGPRPPVVVAKCLPAPIFSPIKEPFVLVEGLGERSVDVIFDYPEVREVVDFIKVHTTTLTPDEEKGKIMANAKKINPILYESAPV
jgi:hypothetical protein